MEYYPNIFENIDSSLREKGNRKQLDKLLKLRNQEARGNRVCNNKDTTSGVKTLLLGDKQIFMYLVPGTQDIYHCFDVDEVDYILETGKDPWNQQDISPETLEELRLWKRQVPEKLGSRSLSEIFLGEEVAQAHFTDEQVKVNLIAEMINDVNPYPDVNAFFNLPMDKLQLFAEFYGLSSSTNEEIINETFKMLNRQRNRNAENFSTFLMYLSKVISDVMFMAKENLSYEELKDERGDDLYLDMDNKQTDVFVSDITDYYISEERKVEIDRMDKQEIKQFLIDSINKVKWKSINFLVKVDKYNLIININPLKNIIHAIERYYSLSEENNDELLQLINDTIGVSANKYRYDKQNTKIAFCITSYFTQEKSPIFSILINFIKEQDKRYLNRYVYIEYAFKTNNIELFTALIDDDEFYFYLHTLKEIIKREYTHGDRLNFIKAAWVYQKKQIVEQLVNGDYDDDEAVKLSPVDIVIKLNSGELIKYFRSLGMKTYAEYKAEYD